jgi:hypothetical protein
VCHAMPSSVSFLVASRSAVRGRQTAGAGYSRCPANPLGLWDETPARSRAPVRVLRQPICLFSHVKQQPLQAAARHMPTEYPSIRLRGRGACDRIRSGMYLIGPSLTHSAEDVDTRARCARSRVRWTATHALATMAISGDVEPVAHACRHHGPSPRRHCYPASTNERAVASRRTRGFHQGLAWEAACT